MNAYTPEELSDERIFIAAVMRRGAVKWTPLIRRLIRPVGSLVECDELSNLFYAKVYEKAELICNRPPEFIDDYLAMMLINLVKDFAKTRHGFRTDNHVSVESCADQQQTSDEPFFIHDELIQKTLDFLKLCLTNKEYEVMELVIYEYKEAEIAEKLQLPVNTVSTLKRRARSKLRDHRDRLGMFFP